jgi:hypothetical protein
MRCDDSQVYFGECDREGLPRLSVQWIGQTELKEEESIMCNSRCIELKITWETIFQGQKWEKYECKSRERE